MGYLSYAFRFGMAVFLLATLAQCSSKKNKSSGATFTVEPSMPIVITGDSTKPDGSVLKSPWFQFRVSMTNGTDTAITIVALSITVYGLDTSGSIVSTDISSSPADYNFNVTSDLSCKFYSFGTWKPNDTLQLNLDNGVTACKSFPIFSIGGNPSGPDGHSFNYRVVIKPQGWFGTYDNPQDRFDTQFQFTTE